MDNDIFSTFYPEIRDSLSALGITHATPVQSRVIPLIRAGKNVIFQSETGTGKTFAYLLPIIENIKSIDLGKSPVTQKQDTQQVTEQRKSRLPKLLVVAPTLELASQIKSQAQNVSAIKTSLFTGNSPIRRQIEMLKEKPEIICGTAARLVELINLQKLKTHDLLACVFDEADRLVKKEMISATNELKSKLPANTQIIACSATITDGVKKLAPDAEIIIMPDEDVLRKKITHIAIYAEARDKIDMLCKFMRTIKPKKMLVFASRQEQVINITQRLIFRKIECDALFSKQDKNERKAALDRFRRGVSRTLITSDLSARGLDIPGVTHVVQMDFPEEKDFFVHRAGRTGRAGESGMNVVIGDAYEMQKFAALEKQLKIIVYPKILFGGQMLAPDEVEYEE